MTSKWETVRLGEIFEPSSTRLGVHSVEPEVFAISKYDGIVLSSDYHDRRVASAGLDKYKVVEPGDWAYSTIHIDEGSIARNSTTVTGVVSPMYTIMKWVSDEHLPEYFELVLKSPAMLATYGDFAQGSINRRRSLPWKTFSTLVVSAPPLPEQRRIVDLIGALDHAIEAAEEQVGNIENSQMAALAELLASSSAPRIPMAGCFSYMIGGAWGSAPSVDSESVLALGPSSFAGNAVNVNQDLGSERSLNAKRASARSLQFGDIILERSGGSPTQPVGRVIRMKDGPSNVVPSDFMRLLRADHDRFNSDYLFWALRSKYVRGESLGYQKFTTGIRNLNITDYLNGTTVPEETECNQDAFVELAESFQRSLDGARDHAQSLRALRTELLTALLSGAHEIPESYDSVMELADA